MRVTSLKHDICNHSSVPPFHASHIDAEAILALDHETATSRPLSGTVEVPPPPLHEVPDLITPTKVCIGIPSARPLGKWETLFGSLTEPIGTLVFRRDHDAVEVRVGVLQCEQIRIWQEGNDYILDFSWK